MLSAVLWNRLGRKNEEIWFIGEYDIERSPTPQISSPVPVLPHRPVSIGDILENHPDTEQPTVPLREMGNEVISRLRTEVSDHMEPIESPDSNVSVSTSDNRKRKSEDVLQTSTAKCSKSEITPPTHESFTYQG